MGWVCSYDAVTSNAYRISVGKSLGKQPFGTPRWRWVDNIKLVFMEIGCNDGKKLKWLKIISNN